MESAQPERTEVDVPFAVVDLDEPDVLLALRDPTETRCRDPALPPGLSGGASSMKIERAVPGPPDHGTWLATTPAKPSLVPRRAEA
jgi:hypothetical protein